METGELKHITIMCLEGYKLNNGNLNGLTQLQKTCILIIRNQRYDTANKNKLFGVISI